MRLHHLRNATGRLAYGEAHFVIDPSLGPAHSWPEVPWIANPRPNPLVDLPIPPDHVFDGVSAVLQTHLHVDHLDEVGIASLPDGLPVFCQPSDGAVLVGHGIAAAEPVERNTEHAGTRIHRVAARHGFGPMADLAGPSSGYVLESSAEPTLYITGDTVWCEDVAETLTRFQPDVIVANAGGAELANGERLIMDVDDVTRLAKAAPQAHIIVVHLEAVSHCLCSREAHRRAHPHRPKVSVPDDGEIIDLSHRTAGP
jgi:L-ascorbate metabolism protein UlaG (beta-lactamase superfamily)